MSGERSFMSMAHDINNIGVCYIDGVELPYKHFVSNGLYEFYGYTIEGLHYYHRIGGPAYMMDMNMVRSDVFTGIWYYVEGKPYENTREYCTACGFSGEETLYWVLKYGEELPTRLGQL
jgi:hypothetical protein